MRAMRLHAPRTPLRLDEVPIPNPGPGQIQVRVRACGVCRTDLHVVDGELSAGRLPLIPGHEIVGTVEARGEGAARFALGTRVGIPWLGWTCGECPSCRAQRENLCDRARFTGYTLDGGYAEVVTADERYAFAIPALFSDLEAAPLMCAGLIGYRSLRLAGDGARIGLYGFGAAAHLVAQVALHQGREVYAFTRPGDRRAREFALSLGVTWAGDSDSLPPRPLDAAILFAPVGELVPLALRAVGKGGVVVCGGIHMSDIPSFPYALLWEERMVRSVANLTRRDGEEFLALAAQVPVRVHAEPLPIEQANVALERLRAGGVEGAAVLVP
jgi:propanol-preferring alcohol dehydrogenase